jgi:predicted homoserine dehydrogenase-like protein
MLRGAPASDLLSRATALMAPLKIGILGAARIADDGIVTPSRVLGHRVVAVAARDRSRAEAFAAQRGIEKVHQTYAEVIDDPAVEVVYDALVNPLHAQWNQYALKAGKHVLSDMNAPGREMVWTVVGTAATVVVPAFAVPQMDNRIIVTRDGSTESRLLATRRRTPTSSPPWRTRCRPVGSSLSMSMTQLLMLS